MAVIDIRSRDADSVGGMDVGRFVERPRVPVRVGPASREGALLVATYDRDTLQLESDVPAGTGAPIGVNVDSSVILDALADGTIFGVEVLVPPSMWKSGVMPARMPTPPERGSVVITDPGPSIEVEELRPRFVLNRAGRLHIELEPAGDATRWVILSKQCFALLNGDFLAGFVADLGAKGRRSR